jgi:hypothetical protein
MKAKSKSDVEQTRKNEEQKRGQRIPHRTEDAADYIVENLADQTPINHHDIDVGSLISGGVSCWIKFDPAKKIEER